MYFSFSFDMMWIYVCYVCCSVFIYLCIYVCNIIFVVAETFVLVFGWCTLLNYRILKVAQGATTDTGNYCFSPTTHPRPQLPHPSPCICTNQKFRGRHPRNASKEHARREVNIWRDFGDVDRRRKHILRDRRRKHVLRHRRWRHKSNGADPYWLSFLLVFRSYVARPDCLVLYKHAEPFRSKSQTPMWRKF